MAFVGASYTFSLQATNLHWWNKVRVSQPVLSLAFLVVLWRLRLLTLNAALIVLALTMLLQLGWAYYRCRSADLVPGRAQARLVRPLARYGMAQIAALTPAALNAEPRPARPFPGRVPARPSAGTRSRSRAACSRSRWCRRSETSLFRG